MLAEFEDCDEFHNMDSDYDDEMLRDSIAGIKLNNPSQGGDTTVMLPGNQTVLFGQATDTTVMGAAADMTVLNTMNDTSAMNTDNTVLYNKADETVMMPGNQNAEDSMSISDNLLGGKRPRDTEIPSSVS